MSRRSLIFLIVAFCLPPLIGGVFWLSTLGTHDLQWWREFLAHREDKLAYSQRNLRWRFADKFRAEELELKQRTLQKIRLFGVLLRSDLPKLQASQKGDVDYLVNWMEQNLLSIDENLRWELGPETDDPDKSRLCITTEGQHELEPIIDSIIKTTPPIPGLRLVKGRDAIPDVNVAGMFAARAPSAGVDAQKLPPYTVACVPNEINLIDVKFFSAEFSTASESQDHLEAFLLSDLVLGERNVDRWLGALDAVVAAEDLPAFDSATAAAEFSKSFHSAIEKIRRSLPARPLYQVRVPEQCVLFQLSSENRLTLNTPYQTFGNALCSEASFYSERYSKFGEKFCFLRISPMASLENPKDRGVVEDELDSLLRKSGLGCVAGGGYGRFDTVFIDVCLADVDKAIPILREFSRHKGFPVETVLMFYDKDWCHEWVGMFEKTSTPALPGKNSRW